MGKTTSEFIGYIIIKWVCFYAYELMMSGANWKTPNLEGIFLAIFMLLSWPVLESIVLYLFLRVAFTQKGIAQMGILLTAFASEFAIGWYITNERFGAWMVVKLILSVSVFTLIYQKQVRLSAF